MKKFLFISIFLHAVVIFVYQLKHQKPNLPQVTNVTISDKAINLKSFNSYSMNTAKLNNIPFNKVQSKSILNNGNNQGSSFNSQTQINLVNASSGIEMLNFVEPQYPAIARQRNLEGRVTIELLIISDGSVEEVKLIKSSGVDILDKAAIESAKLWKFKPRSDSTQFKFTKEIIFQLNN